MRLKPIFQIVDVLGGLPRGHFAVEPILPLHFFIMRPLAWQAETRVDAEAAFDFFAATYGVKYDKAVSKLTKNRDVLLAFYDFPAEHWKHIRTTNPIESTFANVRHRTG